MSSRYRFIWSKLKIFSSYRTVPVAVNVDPKKYITAPCTLSLSLFTWLGFQKKLDAEDELIQTIKHCVLFIQRAEYDKAEQLLHVALRNAHQLRHQLGITYIYDVMANLALEREQLDKAKNLFIAVSQRIMADGAKEDDYRVVHISVKLARISHLKGEHTIAQIGYNWCMEKINKALLDEPTEETKKLLAMTEDWYGRLCLDSNDCERGLKLMVSSLDRMREVTDIEREHIVIQLNDIGTVCDQVGRYDESIQYIKEAIEIGKQLNMDDLGTMYVNLGRAYIKKNLLDEARKNCGHAWKLAVSSKNKDIKVEAESCIKEIKSMV